MKKVLIVGLMILMFCASSAQEKSLKTSDGVDLYVNVKGSGTPCLYIHGGPGSGSFWLEQFLGDSLEQHFQMIYLDQRGVGRSGSPRDQNYSMDRMVRDFEEVRTALGINQWVILGHSFGGILQMGYVESKPNSINGMIFINCSLSLGHSFESSWLPTAIELAGEKTPTICLNPSVSLYERMLAIMPILNETGDMWRIFFAKEQNRDRMNETYGSFTTWNSDQSEVILKIPDYWCDYRPLCPKIKQPVLFFFGRTDWAVGPDHYEGVKFPNMMLWGSDVGHMPFLENKEDLTKAIRWYYKANNF
jgi:proline iminopeptidase